MTAALRLDHLPTPQHPDHLELAERTAQAALDACGLCSGGWPAEVAETLGFRIQEEPGLVPLRIRGSSWPGSGVVLLSPALAERQRGFVTLHEMGHCYLHDRVAPEVLEEACDRFAAALLLPAPSFRHSVGKLGADLVALRKRWPWASWDALGRRLAELYPGVAAGKLESGHWAWRVGGPGGEAAMRQAAALALGTRLGVGLAEDGSAVAWRVTEWPQRAVVVGRGSVNRTDR